MKEEQIELLNAELAAPAALPRGDLVAAMQLLAANNARLCGIVLAADKLASAASAHLAFSTSYTARKLEAAVREFEIARQGQ